MAKGDVPVPGKAQLWKTADGRYRARQPWRGGRQQTFRTQREALDWQAAELMKRREGRSTEKPAERDPSMSMAKVQASYFALREDWSGATRRQQDSNWRKLQPIIGAVHPDDLTTAHVLTLRNTLVKRGLGSGSVKNHLTLLSSLVKFATQQGWRSRPSNPVTDAKATKTKTRTGEGRRRALTADQSAAFLDAVDDCLGVGALIAYQCGLRSGEVRALQVRHIDFLRGTIAVPGTKTAAAVRTVPAPQEVLDAIAAHLPPGSAQDAYIVRNTRNGRMSQKVLDYHWNAAQRATGNGARFHDLRHSFCTDLLDAGVPVATVAKLAGHASPSVTLDVYAHSTPTGEALAKAAMQARAARPVTPASHLGASSAAD